jgi:hypothetical protein
MQKDNAEAYNKSVADLTAQSKKLGCMAGAEEESFWRGSNSAPP